MSMERELVRRGDHQDCVFLSFLGSDRLSPVLEPDLDRAWAHAKLSSKLGTDLSGREEGMLEDPVQDLELLVTGPASFGLDTMLMVVVFRIRMRVAFFIHHQE